MKSAFESIPLSTCSLIIFPIQVLKIIFNARWIRYYMLINWLKGICRIGKYKNHQNVRMFILHPFQKVFVLVDNPIVKQSHHLLIFCGFNLLDLTLEINHHDFFHKLLGSLQTEPMVSIVGKVPPICHACCFPLMIRWQCPWCNSCKSNLKWKQDSICKWGDHYNDLPLIFNSKYMAMLTDFAFSHVFFGCK